MRPVVAGNWKMHHGPSATADFLARFTPPAGSDGPRILLFPPALSLAVAVESVSGREELADVGLGVQNIHEAESGAFTGEVSAAMAVEAGARYALVGHSERRHVFGEADDRVAAKTRAAVGAGLVPVVCVGERLDERKAGRLEAVLLRQLDAALEVLGVGDEWLLAYEPVWAIGTGETATPADASEAHDLLGRRLEARGFPRARVPILYGGSVKPGNAGELLAAEGVDGVLVGGASLDPESFAAIAGAARSS